MVKLVLKQICHSLFSRRCHCKELTGLPVITPWNKFSGVNKFFRNHADREKTFIKLSDAISDLEDVLTLVVTDQVVIHVAKGLSVGSSDLVKNNGV